jgi:hypothetical protein
MAPKRMMAAANQQFNKNVTSRGNIPKSLVGWFWRLSEVDDFFVYSALGKYQNKLLTTNYVAKFVGFGAGENFQGVR